MPWTDPQFWIVSLAATLSIAQILRPFFQKESSPCASCAVAKISREIEKAPQNLVHIGSYPASPTN